MSLLTITSVSKSFSGTPVLRDVTFQVGEGEIVCLLGPSGCGKTTLLRIIAGLEVADAGQVAFRDQSLAGVPVHRRGFGLMFQDFALFPHKDVAANVAFGLRMEGWPRQRIEARVAEMLDLVGLAGYKARQVFDLSGGEQQRVALARALVHDPALVLADEPTGNLDPANAARVLALLAERIRAAGAMGVLVTHSPAAAESADRVLHLTPEGLKG